MMLVGSENALAGVLGGHGLSLDESAGAELVRFLPGVKSTRGNHYKGSNKAEFFPGSF